jgi:hypothetical protein
MEDGINDVVGRFITHRKTLSCEEHELQAQNGCT